MDKQDLIAKLEQEYEIFTNRIAMLPAREIIARADVIAGMHYILEYIRSEDFDISDVSADIATIDIGAEEGLLDDIHDTFRFEMNDSIHYDDLINSLDLVLGNRLYSQQSDYRDEYVPVGYEDEDEMEL